MAELPNWSRAKAGITNHPDRSYKVGHVVAASVLCAISGSEARKMNVSTRPRYRVVTSIYQPFVMYNYSSGTFYGYCIDLLNAMAELSGFDYDIRQAKDFGHVTRSGEWTGMIKDLITDTADISAAPLWVTHSRRQVCCSLIKPVKCEFSCIIHAYTYLMLLSLILLKISIAFHPQLRFMLF